MIDKFLLCYAHEKNMKQWIESIHSLFAKRLFVGLIAYKRRAPRLQWRATMLRLIWFSFYLSLSRSWNISLLTCRQWSLKNTRGFVHRLHSIQLRGPKVFLRIGLDLLSRSSFLALEVRVHFGLSISHQTSARDQEQNRGILKPIWAQLQRHDESLRTRLPHEGCFCESWQALQVKT